MKTRAAYLRGPWKTQLREVVLPDAPAAGHVRLRVEACGICGSDLNAAGATGGEWRPFGHEVAGVVHAVGHGVSGLAPGQRVVLESGSFCGRCALCRDGRVDLCNKAPGFWGQPAMGFAEFMDAPAGAAVPYEGLAPEVACLAEPAGVAIDVLRTAQVELGQRVCVIGPGPIGLMAAALALRQGACEVVCVGRSRSRARLARAEAIGARVMPADGDLSELPGMDGRFDHVLLTAGPELVAPALAWLAYGGRLTYIGMATEPVEIRFDANDFHVRKLQLRSSFASPALYLPAALRLLASGAVPGRELISHVVALDRIQDALELHRSAKDAVVKVVVQPSAGDC